MADDTPTEDTPKPLTVTYLGPSGTLIVDDQTLVRDVPLPGFTQDQVDRIRTHLPDHAISASETEATEDAPGDAPEAQDGTPEAQAATEPPPAVTGFSGADSTTTPEAPLPPEGDGPRWTAKQRREALANDPGTSPARPDTAATE